MAPFLKFLTEDWYFAIPMILMSLTALTLVFWRIFLNVSAKSDIGEFLPIFQQKLEREGVESALRYCRAQQGIIPRRLFAAGLETSKQGLAAMRRAMANAIELEMVRELKFLLPPILDIGKIATMVGLLGTVISMTNTFNKIQEAGSGNVTGHAGAIGLALYATALGLVTAIPLVFAHVLFKSWIAHFEVKIKNSAQHTFGHAQAARPATSRYGPEL